MREGPDKSNGQHCLPARVATEVKATGTTATRLLNRQEEQFPTAARGVGWPEPNMPVRAPMWYRHWGLNE
jgi:hypothetical protein